MFGRKKEKKRHKPGMTQAEISKLEEAGIRRGFFSKKPSKNKEEAVQKRDISRPLSLVHGENKQEGASVLQRATMYGQVVGPQRKISISSSSPVSHIPTFDLPPSAMMQQQAEGSNKYPVPPIRRKVSSKSMQSKPHYDTPKPAVPLSQEPYSTPRSWNQPITEAQLISTRKPASQPPAKTSRQRQVILKKRAAGDFGVSLRRSAMIEHDNNQEIKRTVYFAEPGQSMLSDLDYHDDRASRLYPGDRLIEIDGINVENASRDEIISKIRNAGGQVTFLVQSMQEIDEVSLADSQESQYSIPRPVDGFAFGVEDRYDISLHVSNIHLSCRKLV